MSLHTCAKGLLIQIQEITSQLNPDDYARPLPVLSGSTIGQHIRHTLEFFICLMDARNENRICYDKRKHDQFIENDPKLAMSVTNSLIEFLEKESEDFPLVHEANYEFTDNENIAMNSSFFRELAYNIEHAIHHMALIKVGIKEQFVDIKLPEHFGVASSTVRYLRETN